MCVEARQHRRHGGHDAGVAGQVGAEHALHRHNEELAARFPYAPAYLPVVRLADGTLWNR